MADLIPLPPSLIKPEFPRLIAGLSGNLTLDINTRIKGTAMTRNRMPFRSVLLTLLLLAAAPATGATQPPSETVDAALARADAAVQAIVDIQPSARTFDNTVRAVDDIVARLEADTNFLQFMAYVHPDENVRKNGEQAELRFRNWLTAFLKNEALYNAVQEYAATSPRLEGVDARLLDHLQRDFRRAGMALPKEQRDTLLNLENQLTELSIEFETNIREDETVVPLTREELSGLPDDYFEQLARVGDTYLVNMSYPQFLPVQDFCDNEKTREKTWIAYKRRGGQKNVGVIERIVALRSEIAHLLGYRNIAEYIIEVKSAKSAENVMTFYEELRPMVREKARQDYAELAAAKRAHTGDPQSVVYPWDTSFYTKYLMKTRYSVDTQEVQKYLPLDKVTEGLFSITQSLYGLEYRDVTDQAGSMGMPLWHEDVRMYEVRDTATDRQLGAFMIDLHPRPSKYGHAAQWGLSQHKVWADGHTTLPLAALVCNFTKPTADKPSLLMHDEVETYFHEFGHCLHTILSEAKHWTQSGTNVERDFVEAPSQMFENWVWNADVLATFATHYQTGEPFPRDLLDNMIAARNLGSGMIAERQFFYGLFDMLLHTDNDGEVDSTQLAHDLWNPSKENVELYDPVPNTWFHAAFGHLTGYEAGYYGYQWSLVYAQDMFERFKELGMLDPEAGMYYRKKILARGGTMDALDMITDYLGREPDMTPYLKHLGLDVDGD